MYHLRLSVPLAISEALYFDYDFPKRDAAERQNTDADGHSSILSLL